MTLLRIGWRDLVADRIRSVLHIAAVAPIVAAYLILIAISSGLREHTPPLETQSIVLVSPTPSTPAAGGLILLCSNSPPRWVAPTWPLSPR